MQPTRLRKLFRELLAAVWLWDRNFSSCCSIGLLYGFGILIPSWLERFLGWFFQLGATSPALLASWQMFGSYVVTYRVLGWIFVQLGVIFGVEKIQWVPRVKAFATPSHYGLYHHRLRFRWSSGKFSWWVQWFLFTFPHEILSHHLQIGWVLNNVLQIVGWVYTIFFSQVFMWNYLNRFLFCFCSLVVVSLVFGCFHRAFGHYVIWDFLWCDVTGVVKDIDSRRTVFQFSYQGPVVFQSRFNIHTHVFQVWYTCTKINQIFTYM